MSKSWPDQRKVQSKIDALKNTISMTFVSDDPGPKGVAGVKGAHVDTEALADALGLSTSLGRTALKVFVECAILLDQKNRDYGPGNISAFGEKGVIVRLNDKVERLKTLVWGDKHPEHEKVSDTWLDIANYGVIGLMCHRGLWK